MSPERKIKLHKQRPEDPRVTASSSEESDSEYELELTTNQILHLHPTLPIYPRKVAQKPFTFKTRPKPDTTDRKMHPVP